MRFYTNTVVKYGKLFLRGYENGERIQRKVSLEPYVFVDSKTPTGWKTVYGKDVEKNVFGSYTEARSFVRKYEDVEGFKIYGQTDFAYQYMNDEYPGTIKFDVDLINVINFDIEIYSRGGFPDVNKARNPIQSITMRFRGVDYVYGLKEYTPHREGIIYKQFDSEPDLLSEFIKDWKSFDPDVVTGWNCEEFDMPYLINRIINVLGEEAAKKMSPWGIILEKELYAKNLWLKSPLGVAVLDGMVLYKKFTYENQERYSLDHISMVELGEGKLDYSEYGSLQNLYEQNHQLYIEYNTVDVERVAQIDAKRGLLNMALTMAYDAKVNFKDVLSPVRMWDCIIVNHLLEKNIIVEPMRDSTKDEQIDGAYVKPPQVGRHEWVCSFDLNSLYPHLIMQYNISPETFRGHSGKTFDTDSIIHDNAYGDPEIRDMLHEENVTIVPTGFMFSRDKYGFLPSLMKEYYEGRNQAKKRRNAASAKIRELPESSVKEIEALKKDVSVYDTLQLAKKIQLNSVYGALSNAYFRWFDNRLAEGITSSGQLSIRWIENELNSYLNKVLKTDEQIDFILAADTDSVYITLDRLVEHVYENRDSLEDKTVVEFLDITCSKKLDRIIEKGYQRLAENANAYSQEMKMKREAIAKSGIWTAKKRYALNLYMNEDDYYETPKLKVTGLESVRKSTPAICRQKYNEALELVFSADERTVQKFIKEFRMDHKNMDPETVGFITSANNLEKYASPSDIYSKRTPIGTKSALIYNYFLKKRGLDNKYPLIYSGDKIKFCYLKKPNVLGEDVIGFPEDLPEEFEVHDSIDYKTQFEKSYIKPISSITNVVGWSAVRKPNLRKLRK